MRRGPSSFVKAPGLAAAAWLALATLLCGTPPPFTISAPAAGARLVPGTTVAVEWVGPSDGTVTEMELLLSIDGGGSYRLRVTRELAPAATRLLWRVPQLPTSHARLALRAGSNAPELERIAAESPVFAIEPEPSAPAEELFAAGAEWRPRDALEGDPPPSAPFDLEPQPSIRASLEGPAALSGPRDPALEPRGLRLSRCRPTDEAVRYSACSLIASSFRAPLLLRE